jgi:hypothetical protein
MKFLFVSGIVVFLGSIILIISNYDKTIVDKKGQVVQMKIEKLPRSCIGAKVRYFVTYSYEGMLYEKATRGDFCEKHYIGELIDMKVLKGFKTILRPNESTLLNLLSFGLLGLLGLLISILQWRKIRSRSA